MSANGYTKEQVIEALHGIAGEMHNKMLKGEPPTMTLPVRTKQNISFDSKLGVYKYGKKKSHSRRNLARECKTIIARTACYRIYREDD